MGPAAEAGEVTVLTLIELLPTLPGEQARLAVGIQEAPLAHPDHPTLTCLAGAGTIRAATLLAEIGDCRARFPDPASFAGAAGVAPSNRQSGQFFRCNKQLSAPLVGWHMTPNVPTPNALARDTQDGARARGHRYPHAGILAKTGPGSCGAAGKTPSPLAPTYTADLATATYSGGRLT